MVNCAAPPKAPTVAGTAATAGFELVRIAPVGVAGEPLNVTVPTAEAPPITVEGLMLREVTCRLTAVRIASELSKPGPESRKSTRLLQIVVLQEEILVSKSA
jgi:hypothetical protein